MPVRRGCLSFGVAAWIMVDARSSGCCFAQVRWMDKSPLGGFKIWQTARRALRGVTHRSAGTVHGFARGSDRLATRSRRQAGLTRGCVWIGWIGLLWRCTFGSAAISEKIHAVRRLWNVTFRGEVP